MLRSLSIECPAARSRSGEGGDPDHRSGLALHEGSNFPESAYPGWDLASAEQQSFRAVQILETRHRPLARDWELGTSARGSCRTSCSPCD